jgi:hypothetical protein
VRAGADVTGLGMERTLNFALGMLSLVIAFALFQAK